MAHRGNHTLFGLLFLNFLLYGGVTTLVGATLPLIIKSFDWSYLAAGVVIASGSIGYFATTFLAGLWIARIGPRRLITLGLLLQGLGLGGFGLSSQVPLNMVALALLGIGQGTTEVVTNYSVVQMEPTGQSRLLNLMHAAFTIGAVAAPVVIGLLIDLSDRWRLIYSIAAVLSLIMLVILKTRTLRFAEAKPAGRLSLASLAKVTRDPLLLLLSLTVLLYVGAEIGISSWIAEFYVSTFAVSASTGAYLVSVFWLGILLGRLLTSMLSRGHRQTHLLLGLATMATVCLMAAMISRDAVLAGVMFFAAGLGFSAIYPIVMAIAGAAFAEQQGMAIGVVSTGGGLGACVFPLLMSVMSNQWGIRAGFWFYLGLTAVMWLMSIGVFLRFRRRPEASH